MAFDIPLNLHKMQYVQPGCMDNQRYNFLVEFGIFFTLIRIDDDDALFGVYCKDTLIDLST